MKLLVTGAAGQDGRLLITQLHKSDHLIHATTRAEKPSWLPKSVTWGNVDVTKAQQVAQVVSRFEPEIVFHFAGSSSVAKSWESPQEAIFTNSIGTTNVLEACRLHAPQAQILIAGSSEVFGRGSFTANELTELSPASPYGVSKAMNLELARLYQSVYGIPVTSLIMFNHESNFRSPDFVSKSIAIQAARVKLGLQSEIVLRDLEASKDWGWAEDFVRAMTGLAFNKIGGDFILATGERTKVRELAAFALSGLGLSPELVTQANGSNRRPNDSHHPVGDFRKLENALGWRPETDPSKFMAIMARSCLEELAGQSA